MSVTERKIEAFDYLAWKDLRHQKLMHGENFKGDHLELASDGTTCWGKTYLEAVEAAIKHDRREANY